MSASTCSNVEIKAKIPNSMEETRKIAQRLAGPEYKPELLIQVDTFFNAPLCRLKLRHQNGKETFLISYSRPDNTDGPKLSTFIKTPIVDHNSMRNLLEMSMGIKGIVKKQRELYLVSWKGLTSRIHLDIVEGLGEFIEFEVMIPDLNQKALGEEFAAYLTQQFGLTELLSGAYMDKILNAHTGDLLIT